MALEIPLLPKASRGRLAKLYLPDLKETRSHHQLGQDPKGISSDILKTPVAVVLKGKGSSTSDEVYAHVRNGIKP